MRVLIACEESQEVAKEFRRHGHEAYSCDLQECSGGKDIWHLNVDALQMLKLRWDLIIAHPPCTHLCVSGARHFEKKRADGRQEDAIRFFAEFLNAKCDHIAIENPVGIISGDYIMKFFPELSEELGLPIKPTQAIQPYEFGDPHRKTTHLWLKGLPPLKPTNIVEPTLVEYTCKSGKKVTFDEFMIRGFEGGDRSKHRSKTFPGIARAMADQWCEYMGEIL